MPATSGVNTPRYLGIWGNTVRFSGSGSLTIEAQTFPIQSGGIETSGSVDLTLRSYMNGTVTRSMAVAPGRASPQRHRETIWTSTRSMSRSI